MGFGGPKTFHHEFQAFVGHFGHQNGWILKLELLLRPSLKTRGHYGSAHFFGSVKDFWKCPKNRFKKYVLAFFYQINKNSI